MAETTLTCMHWHLGRDEACEACGKTVAEIARDERAAENTRIVAGLRGLADLLSIHPDLAPPDVDRILVYVGHLDDPKAEIAAWARAVGRADKYASGDDYFGITARFGPVALDVYAARGQVCERVVVGSREVTREVPDPDAPLVTVTETVEEVEWRCAPLLAGAEEVA